MSGTTAHPLDSMLQATYKRFGFMFIDNGTDFCSNVNNYVSNGINLNNKGTVILKKNCSNALKQLKK